MLVHIITDYGFGDLAFAEVVQHMKLHLPDAEPVLTLVPAFATLAAGFCTYFPKQQLRSLWDNPML